MGLERINHYLAPIVDELLELWNGWRIPKTHECPEGVMNTKNHIMGEWKSMMNG